MLQQVNLYQAELRPQSVAYPALRLLQMLAVIVLVLVCLSAYLAWQLNPLREQALRAEQRLAAADSRVEKLRAEFPLIVLDNTLVDRLRERRVVLEQTQETVRRLNSGAYGSVDGLSKHLAGIARQHVEGTWLTAVHVDSGGSDLALRGKTLLPELVPTYLERLSGEATFSGKTFSELQLTTVSDGLDAISFSVNTPGMSSVDGS